MSLTVYDAKIYAWWNIHCGHNKHKLPSIFFLCHMLLCFSLPPTHTHTHTQTSITAEIKGGVKSPITNDSAVKFRLQSEHQTFCQPFSLPSYDTFVAAAATGTDFHHCQCIHLVQWNSDAIMSSCSLRPSSLPYKSVSLYSYFGTVPLTSTGGPHLHIPSADVNSLPISISYFYSN